MKMNKNKNTITFLLFSILFSFCSLGEYSREDCIEQNQEFYDTYEQSLIDRNEYETKLSNFTGTDEFRKYKAILTLGFDEAYPISSFDSNINNFTSPTSIKKLVIANRYDIEFLIYSPNKHIYFVLENNEENDMRSEHFVKFKDDEKIYSFYVGKNEDIISNLNNDIEIYLTNRFIEYYFLTFDTNLLLTNEDVFSEEFEDEISEIKLLAEIKGIDGDSLNEISRNFYKDAAEKLSIWKYFFTEHPECLDVPEVKYVLSENIIINDALDRLYNKTIEDLDGIGYSSSN